jgi:hypothetical protein
MRLEKMILLRLPLQQLWSFVTEENRNVIILHGSASFKYLTDIRQGVCRSTLSQEDEVATLLQHIIRGK